MKASFRIADNMVEQADVVKIEAEGAEASVLRGMRQLIKDCPPIFLIENNDYTTVTEFLQAYGYGVYRYEKGCGGLLPMSGATTNCFYLKQDHIVRFSIGTI